MKPVVKLWSLVGTGLIVPRDTGVIYTNQTDGTACDHPTLEGAFIPLSNDYNHERFEDSLESKLCALYPEGWGAPSIETCDLIDQLLAGFHASAGIRVDRDRMSESREAWMWVILDENEKHDFEGFGRSSAILTWPNSD
ncbi:hypothetical protein BH11VER1_BH11VER1_20970 [soil metagenome]